ncbi:MAG: nucleotidyltransferase domain-containing protein [Candidatus Aenigmatarchaeota archaeon]
MNEFTEKVLESIMEKLKQYPEVVGVYLFGSCVKDNTKPLSDIDIAVILKDPNSKSEADIGSMYSERIDLVLFHKLPLHIKFEVFKYGKEIFVKDEDFIFELKLGVLKEYLETRWLYERIKSKVLK